jgi:hypothetical protein
VRTTLQLLDEFEARIAELRARAENATSVRPVAEAGNNGKLHWESPPPDLTAAHRMRVEMGLAGLSKTAFASVFQVPVSSVQEWMAGDAPIPEWVLPSLRIFELLTPALQQQVVKRPLPPVRVGGRRNAHPFSRIEEL